MNNENTPQSKRKVEASAEQILVLGDHRKLVSASFDWLVDTYNSAIHTNRIIDTGWQKVSFEFTVTDAEFVKCFAVRVLRKPEDIELLKNYLDEVNALINSGIKDLGIIFSLTLILSIPNEALDNDIHPITRQYPFVETIKYL